MNRSFATLLALSLVGVPLSMADWGEQASISVERVDQSAVNHLGPEFDFSLLASIQFVWLGRPSICAFVVLLVRPPDRLLDAIRN